MKNDNFQFNVNYYLPGIIITVILGGVFLNLFNKLNEVGTYLSGAGTIGLFFLAFFQIPYEIKKFQSRKHEERVSDISFELSEITVKYVSVIKHLMSRFSFSNEVRPEDEGIDTGRFRRYKSLIKTFKYRVSVREIDIQRFFDNFWKISYLKNPIEIEEKFVALRKVYFDLSMQINILQDVDDSWDPVQVQAEYNKYFEVISETTIDQIKADLLRLLAENH